jgi:MFS family permease
MRPQCSDVFTPPLVRDHRRHDRNALPHFEATVVGTAMPTIVAALGGLAHYSWVFSAYLLTSTVTVPVWGKLSDLFGRRRLFQIGVAVFILGSAACGFSQTMTQLILSRAVQGLGAGALVPLAMTIIGDIFTLEERAKMQGLFSGVWGISSIFGPLVGGFITDQLSWRGFFLNLPVGIAVAIIGIALRERCGTKSFRRFIGATVLTLTVTILLLFSAVESRDAAQRVLMRCHRGDVLVHPDRTTQRTRWCRSRCSRIASWRLWWGVGFRWRRDVRGNHVRAAARAGVLGAID